MNISLNELVLWLGAVVASLVGLLTLYNAAKLKTGILAVATYSFGAGMFCIAATLLMQILLQGQINSQNELVMRVLYLVGFLLLGYGSYRIYQMSKI